MRFPHGTLGGNDEMLFGVPASPPRDCRVVLLMLSSRVVVVVLLVIVAVGGSNAAISKIFEWYAVDFGNITDYLNKYASTKVAAGTAVTYKEYNWALNE